MEIYLAGQNGIHRIIQELHGGKNGESNIEDRPNVLESFYHITAASEKIVPLCANFMLDSGAYTFMVSEPAEGINWDGYVDQYADYIKRNKVRLFFELDIDDVVGYDEVKRLRRRLENAVGLPSIPVWHKGRGKDEFVRLCDAYDYVAIGGYVAGMKTNAREARRYVATYPWFIRTAHEHGAKIHGLGYTSLEGLERHHFDSVDSTAWLAGSRFGFLWKFNGRTMTKIDAPKGHRITDPRAAALLNYKEWIKYQKWARSHL